MSFSPSTPLSELWSAAPVGPKLRDVLATGFSIPAHSGRRGKAKVYDFQELRNGIEYPQKRVEVYYVDAGDALFAVTVYVFYGKWEKK
jgi:hypothetical protein